MRPCLQHTNKYILKRDKKHERLKFHFCDHTNEPVRHLTQGKGSRENKGCRIPLIWMYYCSDLAVKRYSRRGDLQRKEVFSSSFRGCKTKSGPCGRWHHRSESMCERDHLVRQEAREFGDQADSFFNNLFGLGLTVF